MEVVNNKQIYYCINNNALQHYKLHDIANLIFPKSSNLVKLETLRLCSNTLFDNIFSIFTKFYAMFDTINDKKNLNAKRKK